MAKHEFAIMLDRPKYEDRFDEYEPHKYNFIEIDDDFIEPILADLENIDFYWHSLKVKGKGIAYCGITLIPPISMGIVINLLLIQNKLEYSDLISLLEQAIKENKYIIHFGL